MMQLSGGQFSIGKRVIGAGYPAYLVAEVSANHKQDFNKAAAIIRAAKDAGADAVKLQTYTADTLTLDSDKPWFRIGAGSIWEGRNLYQLYEEAYTPWEWHPGLKQVAVDAGLDFFSTPFDSSAVEFLETLDVPAHKIASFELVDLPLIRQVAATGKPLIMSTGMATLEEIQEAVDTARAAGATGIALLKCTSAYPSPPEEMNLRAIPYLAQRFGVPIGLSDHTMDVAVPVVAVSLGASIIEKHLTLSRSDGGPDGAFSLEPQEFKAMADAIRIAEKALGEASLGAAGKEEASRAFRRSLFVVQDVKAGERFNAGNVRSIRPGQGLHTRYLPEVMGLTAACNIERGTPLSWEMIARP